MSRHGFPMQVVRLNMALAWPLVRLCKRLALLPGLEWLARPFFHPRFNQVTALPIQRIAIGEQVAVPGCTLLPLELLERLIARAAAIFIVDECVCRRHTGAPLREIGCLALGVGAHRIHPSLGRQASVEQACGHARRAAQAGLVANVAHVWIDPLGFGVPDFRHVLFVCFCGEAGCLYTDDLARRHPGLDQAYQRLPGIELVIDRARCVECGTCAANCFVQAIEMQPVRITAACKGCGRCIAACPQGAIGLRLDDEDALFGRLLARVRGVVDIESS